MDALDAAKEAQGRGDLDQAVRWYEEAEARLRGVIWTGPLTPCGGPRRPTRS
jgi:hypothetical protein